MIGKFNKLLLYASIFFVLFLFFSSFFKPVVLDLDLGRHLLFGKIMLDGKEVINTNLISYTNPEFTYVNSHWLSEIIFYLIYKAFGANGLIIFSSLISLLTLGLIFKFGLVKIQKKFIPLLLSVFAIFFVVRSDVRPEIFSYLLLSVFIVLLYKFRDKYTNLIFFLIPLIALWVNLHIFFVVGPFLIFVFLLERLIIKKFRIDHKTKVLIIVLTLSLIATLFNPSFLSGALNPLLVFNNYGYQVQENQSILALYGFFHSSMLALYVLYILSITILLVIYHKKTNLIDWALILIFSIAAILIIRNFYLLLLVSFFTFIKLFSLFLNDILKTLRKHMSEEKIQKLEVMGFFFLCLILFSTVLRTIFSGGFGFGQIERGQKALNLFIDHHLKGPIYNNFDLGQYIAYRLYPDEKVFVDGRPEAYPAIFLQDVYTNSVIDLQNFKKIDEKYNFNTIFIYNDDSVMNNLPLLSHLSKTNKYKIVYLDYYVSIFLKNNQVNGDLLKNLTLTEDNFKLEVNQPLEILARYIILFDKIGWVKQEKKLYNYLQQIDPSGCALKNALNFKLKKPRELKNIKLDTSYCGFIL